MSLYHGFFLAVLLLWVFSSPKDKGALRIVLLATIGSMIATSFTRGIIAPWKLVVPATVEALTILALLKWAKNRTGYLQAGLLVIAWAAHLICYYDLKANTDWVYSRYETVLLFVGIGQLVACYDTLWHNWGALLDWVESIRLNRSRGVSAGGIAPAVSHSSGREIIP